MNPDDKDIFDFARLWIPYGGPRRGDILVKFGMTPSRFYGHLTRIVEEAGVALLSPEERRFLDRLNEPSKSTAPRKPVRINAESSRSAP
ncbi:DUF3263 domain-containing protein [Rhodococcus koreensis]|uniref:DUF3263 domain-containing protein n=1 Tax=Rhodococcus koreensis TaxID=99653 RepID=UPI003672FC86